jgi:hypothetical protein
MLFKPEFDSDFQVDVSRKNTSFSPLSPRERARVRGDDRPDATKPQPNIYPS